MSRSGINFGFGFFKNPASFAVGEDLLNYRAQDSYIKVVQTGIVNSLRLVAAGVITGDHCRGCRWRCKFFLTTGCCSSSAELM